MHTWDLLFADWAAPSLSFGFSVLSPIYPDAGNPGTTTVDGYMANQNEATWSDAVTGNGDQNSGTDTAEAYILIFRSGGGSNQCRRSRFGFDTTSLSGSTLLSGTVSFKGTGKADTETITPNINVYGGTFGSNTTMANADYQGCASTAFSTAISYASWSTSAYNDFALNASGLAGVNLGGITNFSLRNPSYDVANSTPGASSPTSYLQGNFADLTGTTSDPKLVLTTLDASKTAPDTGTGTDAKSINVTVPTRADTGTGSDTRSISVTIPARADTGTGSDTKDITAMLTRTDTGTGVDAKSISVSQTQADTGTGTEATSISATVPARTDTGTGSDATGVQNTINRSDSGAGSDVVAIMAAITRADTGAASEALAILAAIAVADTGSSSEQVALSAYVSVSDTVTASDAVAVLAAIARSDSGIATDAVAVMAHIAVSDSGVASEALAFLVTMSLADNGGDDDTVAILAHIGVSDHVNAADALAVAFFIAVQDSTPHGVDALSFLISPSVSDSISGSDAVSSVEIFRKMLNDAGQGNDAIAGEFIRLSISEHGTGSDLVNLVKRIYPYVKRTSPYTKLKP